MLSGYKGLIKPPPGTPINPFHPLSQGLVGYWPFNEGAGSRANDISGHGNHGTLKNMSPNAQGSGWGGSKFGGGIGFDGSGDYIICVGTESLKAVDAITIELWLYPQTLSGVRCLLYKGTTTNYWNYIDNATINMYIQIGGVHREVTYSLPSAKKLYHVVETYDNNISAPRHKLFINGILKSTNDFSTGTIANNSDNLEIGRYYGGGQSSWDFNGSIDSVRVYNRALSAPEIKTLYHDPFCNLLRVPVRYVPAVPAGAIMNQFQNFNIGADLYNGAIIA